MFDSRHVCLTASFLLLLCSGGMLGSLLMMTHSVKGASHACTAKRHKACPAHQLASWQGDRDVTMSIRFMLTRVNLASQAP